jgi:hypothetical protein
MAPPKGTERLGIHTAGPDHDVLEAVLDEVASLLLRSDESAARVAMVMT